MTRGQFIAYRREFCDYKKIEFCRLLGITDDSLRAWERDRFKPAGINLRNLVKYLKLSHDDIKTYFEYEYVPTNNV